MKILFVCMGNICRSPTAHGVFEQLLNDAPDLDVLVDSAGTHAYHVGNPPDSRSQEAAARRGYDLSAQRARKVAEMDFETFDLVLAMDRANLENLRAIADTRHHSKIRLFLEFASDSDVREVPDPYYGAGRGFEEVLDLVEDAARGLLEHVRQQASGR
ncbi:MAG: low molecular weight protein-tyrosine-phosphatase [Gammaproteobacteria bacterium]|nr:low molecular weight protein-tyrosine-phosphatase [Gammaproteobacteria bacterium]